MRIYEYTNKGNRAQNQDFVVHKVFSDSSAVFVVADGMGGYSHGDIASELVAKSIVEYIECNIKEYNPSTLIRDSISYANDNLMLKRLSLGGEKMGTVVAILLIINGLAYISWLGDSRVYIYRNHNQMFQTKDHSMINRLLEIKSLSVSDIEKYASIVTSAVMGNESLGDIPIDCVETKDKDVFLLCTDGFHKEIDVDYAIEYNDTQKEELDKKSLYITDNYSFIKVEM